MLLKKVKLMKFYPKYLLVILFCSIGLIKMSAQQTENIVLVTIDGLRWQEVFGGIDEEIRVDKEFAQDSLALQAKYSAPSKEEARLKLMPWLWGTLAKEGQIYGNRWIGNKMDCTNIFRFSYPGYNEILTGFSDPYVDSNAKLYNKNQTVLEWLHHQPGYFGKVAAFASWDVFPYIINDKRSGIPVSIKGAITNGKPLSQKEKLLNKLIEEMPPPFGGIRWDGFTFELAMEYIKKNHPKVLYIAFDETDDNAHASAYDKYLHSAHATDDYLSQLWAYLQSNPFYKDKTSLIIVTDHGRGDETKAEWTSHGKTIKGASEIWLAAIGPDTKPLGVVTDKEQRTQSQVAATLAALLGHNYTNPKSEVGKVIDLIINK